VVAKEGNEELGGMLLEEEAETKRPAAFEEPIAELSDPKASVNVRPTEAFRQLAQRQQALHPVVLRQLAQALQDIRRDRKSLTQATCEVVRRKP
jgi:hypothetical protein